MEKKIKIKKNGSGEEYQVVGNFIQPCLDLPAVYGVGVPGVYAQHLRQLGLRGVAHRQAPDQSRWVPRSRTRQKISGPGSDFLNGLIKFSHNISENCYFLE